MMISIHEERKALARLTELGLDEEQLRTAVQSGEIERASCTGNDPGVFPGLAAWARTVRVLREDLLPSGWTKYEPRNLALVVNAKRTIAITVSSGNGATGMPESSPETRNPKGYATLTAVQHNQRQLWLFSSSRETVPSSDAGRRLLTWILLIWSDGEEVRYELSLPSYLDDHGRVVGWVERIILSPFRHDTLEPLSAPEDEPDVEVKVRRRAD